MISKSLWRRRQSYCSWRKRFELIFGKQLNDWNRLAESFKSYDEVETVLSIKDLQKLVKNTKKEQFDLEPFIKILLPA